jgi:hypothetical protein
MLAMIVKRRARNGAIPDSRIPTGDQWDCCPQNGKLGSAQLGRRKDQ